MNVVRYKKAAGSSFAHLWDGFFNGTLGTSVTAGSFYPNMDISESGDAFELQLAVPGMDKSAFHISVEEDRLIIRGERKLETGREGRRFRAVGTQYGKFSKVFKLPDTIDQEKIGACYEAGMLSVTLPKGIKKTSAIEVK